MAARYVIASAAGSERAKLKAVRLSAPVRSRRARPVLRGPRLLSASFGVLILTAIARPAAGQEAIVETPESLFEGAEPIGLRYKAFLFYPRVTADLRYDSNIYNRADDEIDDAIAVIRPALTVTPDLARHQLRLDLAGEIRRYMDTSEENSEQLSAQLSGRADLRGRTAVHARLLAARRIEGRGTFGDELRTDEPVTFFEKHAEVAIARTGGKLELSGEASLNDKTFDDARIAGVPVDLDFRDVRKLVGKVRTGYRIGPKIAIFGEASANKLSYHRKLAVPRGSKGYSLLAGARVDVSDLIEAEAAVGYLHQNFDNPQDRDINGFDYHLALSWTPTPRLRLAAAGSRSIERSPFPDVSSVVESDVRASAVYTFGRKLMTGIEAGFIKQQYSTIDRSERRFFGEASLRYQINPRFSAFGAAGYRDQNGSGLGARRYSGFSFRVGLRWAP